MRTAKPPQRDNGSSIEQAAVKSLSADPIPQQHQHQQQLQQQLVAPSLVKALSELNSQIKAILMTFEQFVNKREQQQIELRRRKTQEETDELETVTRSAREHLKRHGLL